MVWNGMESGKTEDWYRNQVGDMGIRYGNQMWLVWELDESGIE